MSQDESTKPAPRIAYHQGLGAACPFCGGVVTFCGSTHWPHSFSCTGCPLVVIASKRLSAEEAIAAFNKRMASLRAAPSAT